MPVSKQIWHKNVWCAVLAAIAQINQATEIGNASVTFAALEHEDAHIMNLDESCQDKYQKCLWKAKIEKQRVIVKCVVVFSSF